jgi:outer membrane lipoprotein-sorting protein
MHALSASAILAAALLAPAATPTLDEIVAKHVAARGGLQALHGLRTVRMTGHAKAGPGRDAIVRREIARPGRIRTELEYQGMTGVYAWDGTAGWRVSPLDGSLDAEPLAADDAVGAAEQADIEGPLVDWKAKGHTVELAGTETLPGGPAHVLKVTLKTGGVRRIWLDAASGQMVRAESTRRLRGHELVVETTYSDYQPTNGVSFPRAIETGVRGRPRRLRITVDSVETNLTLDDSRFKMPR